MASKSKQFMGTSWLPNTEKFWKAQLISILYKWAAEMQFFAASTTHNIMMRSQHFGASRQTFRNLLISRRKNMKIVKDSE